MASRKIYNVRYRLGEGKIYDETPFVAETTTAMNSRNEAATISVSIEYVGEKSYFFNNSNRSSAPDGVPTTLQAGIPLIVRDHSIQIGHEITISPCKWGEETMTTTSVEVLGLISVPANSVATISYGGTKGKCDIPFSYTQQDTSASGGVVVTHKSDGIFKGSNPYYFGFSVENVAARLIS